MVTVKTNGLSAKIYLSFKRKQKEKKLIHKTTPKICFTFHSLSGISQKLVPILTLDVCVCFCGVRAASLRCTPTLMSHVFPLLIYRYIFTCLLRTLNGVASVKLLGVQIFFCLPL